MFRGELEQVWRRIEDHQRQLDRMRCAQTELCEENAALLEMLQCSNGVGVHLSAQLHRRRFNKVLQRFPLETATMAGLLPAMQTSGFVTALAECAGLPILARIAATARGMQDPVNSALEELSRGFQKPKVYVIGGAQNNQALDVVECFDPESSKWQTLSSMPTPRSDLAAAAVDGALYAIGGYDGRTLSAVELFDPRKNAWEPLAPMPSPRSDFVAAAESGRVYRLGGLDEYYEALDTCQRFDPETNAWETLAPLRIPRWSFAVCVIDRRVYAVGGVDMERQAYYILLYIVYYILSYYCSI